MHKVHRTIHHVHRISMAALILMCVVAVGFSFAAKTQSAAAAQVNNRSIKLSDSTAGAGSVHYFASFDISNAYGGNMKSYLIDFCQEDPLPADVCTAPAGMDASGATAAGGNTGTWAVGATASQIRLSDPTGIAQGSTVTIDLGGITNPSSTGSFYARIYTFSNSTFGTYANPQNPGNYVDSGGDALSLASPVSLSAFVQEQLSFCVSATLMAGNCAGQTAPNITIGHGSPVIVDGSQVDANAAYMQTSTNAQSGAQIRMKSNNACGGMSSDGGVTCPLPPAGNAAISFTPGTADFGANVAPSTGGIGSVTPTAPYNQNAATKFAMVMGAGGVNSLYGSQIANSGTGCNNVNNAIVFGATASNITPADTYHATYTLIATGTF